MNKREKLHALVLARRDINEADRLVTLFSRQQGLLRVLAKGVRRIPSRRGGHLEPLTYVLAIVTGTADRKYLAAVETVDDHLALRGDVQAWEHAEMLARLVLGLFEEEEVQVELFDALYHACQMFPELPAPKRDFLEVAVAGYALRCAGLQPDLNRCQACGRNQPDEAVILNPQAGGWRCLSCHDSFVGTQLSLPPRLLRALRWLGRYPQKALQLSATKEESRQVLAAMRYYAMVVAETVPMVRTT
ncbi:MAG: DNA repair protein RecO [Candidatus Andersenbacteria bacterium]|nr:DNA repair protein RecO [bacterium]MDZ4225234.1 DNA repair protein RecO [Candidatus Andersenbacteria bacterium]